VSLHSQNDPSGLHLNRAKSVFRGHGDPYFPSNNKGDLALPTSDDYIFRVQVLSTTVDVSSIVFKKAVQGLVKICFPQDVLEEIGIEVVTQHMRNEGAPEHNIAKMTEIFRSEMCHRVNWMLAEYLDTPPKVEASVKAVIAASASLHGAKIGDDILGHVITSLQSLRENIPHSSTEILAGSTDIETMTSSTHEPGGLNAETDDSNSQCEAHASAGERIENWSDHDVSQPPVRAGKKGKRLECDQKGVETGKNFEVSTHQRGHASPDNSNSGTIQYQRDGKAGKISTSWRWNIAEDASFEDAVVQFKRMSDLFAYHTLPLVRQRLGQQANRKQLRQKMETMLANMTDQEFALWLKSFQCLKGGDSTILKRRKPPSQSATHQDVSATPAPLAPHSKMPGSTALFERDNPESKKSAAESCNTPTEAETIKHETKLDDFMEEFAARIVSAKREDRISSTAARDAITRSGMADPVPATIPTAGTSTSALSLQMVTVMSDSADCIS
jgi:hypothetical protein